MASRETIVRLGGGFLIAAIASGATVAALKIPWSQLGPAVALQVLGARGSPVPETPSGAEREEPRAQEAPRPASGAEDIQTHAAMEQAPTRPPEQVTEPADQREPPAASAEPSTANAPERPVDYSELNESLQQMVTALDRFNAKLQEAISGRRVASNEEAPPGDGAPAPASESPPASDRADDADNSPSAINP